MSDDNLTRLRAYIAAADVAYDDTRWSDAIPEYETALSLLPELSEAERKIEPELLTRLGSCYWAESDARTAWRTLRRAIAMFRDAGDGAGMARATVEVLRIWGPQDRQVQMADEALELLGDTDPYLRARLLLSTSWRGFDERWHEAIRIAEAHGYEDILASRIQDESWKVLREGGDIEEAIRLAEQAHEVYAGARAYEPACGSLRNAAFETFEHGQLDRGAAIARRCVKYARSVHLRFHEELALTDLAGEAFARADYERCSAVLDELTTNTDFRADLYRMWIVELSGDTRAAVQLMVDPERAGRAATGMSQTHGAAAGVLYRAGHREAAERELYEWAAIARKGRDFNIEAPVLWECIVDLGDDLLAREVCASFEESTPGNEPVPTYCTLSGRAVAPTHGALLLRLGRVDDAESVFSEGLSWCERERVPVEGGLCLEGLADVAARRGDEERATEQRGEARALFERHGARLYIDAPWRR